MDYLLTFCVLLFNFLVYLYLYRTTTLPNYKYYFAFADFGILLLSFSLADILQDYIFLHSVSMKSVPYPFALSVYSFATSIFIFIFQSNNLYKINIILSRSQQVTAIIKSLIFGIITLILFTFIFKFPFISDSRLYIVIFSILALIALFWIRVIIMPAVYKYFTKHEVIHKNTIIIGTGKSAQMLAAKLGFENSYGIKIAGFIAGQRNIGEEVINGIKVIGTYSQLPYLRYNEEIHEVIIAVDNVSYEKLLEIIDTCNQLEVNVKLISELFDIIPKKILTENYSGIPLIDVSPKIDTAFVLLFKRIFDFTAAVAGLIILSPLFIILGILIKLSSPGPVLYKQTRVGLNGKTFPFYKFRSMTVKDNEDKERQEKMIEFIKASGAGANPDTKIVNFNRITWIGKIIRKTSIDELPQLFNVLRGDMSLVGPRPCLPYEYENFEEWHKRRHAVLPGCTGVWQVSGRSKVSFKDSVILDLYYIKNMTPWLDLQIILKTIPVMLFARGGK